MRIMLVVSLAFLFLSGLRAPAVAETAKGDATSSSPGSALKAADSLARGCRSESDHWYRTTAGKTFVWVPGKWVPLGSEKPAARPVTTGSPPAPVYRTSNYPPVDVRPKLRVEITYPNDSHGTVINGIDWYLNGRGPFSD